MIDFVRKVLFLATLSILLLGCSEEKSEDKIVVSVTSYNDSKETSGNKNKPNVISNEHMILMKVDKKTKNLKEKKKLFVEKVKYKTDDLLSKLKEKKFGEVDKYFDKIIYSREKAYTGIQLSVYIYDSLSSRYQNDEIEIFKEWCSNTNKHSAFVTRGKYYVKEAWRIRNGAHNNDEDYNEDDFHSKVLLALNDFEEAYSRNPMDLNIYSNMIKVAKWLGLQDAIIDIWYERGITLDSSFYYCYANRLYTLLPRWGGNWDKAFDYSYSLFQDPPEDSLAYTLLLNFFTEIQYRNYVMPNGTQFNEKTTLSLVDEIESKYKTEFPDSDFITIPIERIRGGQYFINDYNYQAEISFRTIIDIDPEYSWAWYMLGQMNSKSMGKPKEAIVFFDKAIELNDGPGLYYMERAYAASKGRLYDQCVSDYSIAFEKGYVSRKSYMIRADCYIGLENFELALIDYNSALEFEPNNTSTLRKRAELYRDVGKVNKAIVDIENILRVDPQNKWALNAIQTFKVDS